jgi:hypothetical protein
VIISGAFEVGGLLCLGMSTDDYGLIPATVMLSIGILYSPSNCYSFILMATCGHYHKRILQPFNKRETLYLHGLLISVP